MLDIYRHCEESALLWAKGFAVGVRVEHSRMDMDRLQFVAGHEALGTTRYRLSWHDKTTDLGTYSFCMCPGGYVFIL